jgi:hypothetical protein
MPYDAASLDAAFAAVKSYDWGGDAAAFQPIDEAVIATHGDKAARGELEKRLAALLGAGTSRAAKEYVCRKLSIIGTAASVPPLAALLADKDNSHMARFALERMPAPEAVTALREALATAPGDIKIGLMASLAKRRDAASVPLIAAALKGEPKAAVAAAEALGIIQSPDAVQALAAVDVLAGTPVAAAALDASLACAEAFLRQGKRAEAKDIYQSLAKAVEGKPAAKAIALAATRGLVACADSSTAL